MSVLQQYTKEPLSGTKSRTHEICADGVSYQSSQYQNVLLSTVSDELALILQDGPSFTIVDTLPDGRFKWLCKSGDVAAVARAVIVRDGEPKAFIGADFSTTTKPERIDRLCEYAGRIEMLLFQ